MSTDTKRPRHVGKAWASPDIQAAIDAAVKRGGPGRGQGRKPLVEGVETVTLSLRMTPAQRDKLARLGGAQWVRDRIDKAKEPTK